MKRHVSFGFTLIELLIVIALIAVLAGAVVIALNPARQFAAARNSERWSHVSAIVGAVTQNATENRGTFTCAAGALPATSTAITKSGGYDLCSCLVPTQMAALPFDPSTGSYTDCTTYATGYTIAKDGTTGRVTVAAPDAENSATISVTQ